MCLEGVCRLPEGVSDGGADGSVVEDAGSDGGFDGGSDAGDDGGIDAGSDAGNDGGFDAGSDAGSDAGTDAGSDAGMDASVCDAGSQSVVAEADALIAPSNNNWGAGQIANSAIGPVLLRFKFTDAKAVAALRPDAGSFRALTLELARATSNLANCGFSSPCPTYGPGNFFANVLTNAWTEGTVSNATGVCWLAPDGMSATSRWGADGANLVGTDIGGVAGTTESAGTSQTHLSFPLDVSMFHRAKSGTMWMNLTPVSAQLSIKVVADAGTGMVFATRENPDVTYAKPTLVVDYCR